MKRIIAVMATLMFAAILFNINVSALPDDMTAEEYELYMEYKQQFERDYLDLVSAYQHGHISYDEFIQNSNEITERYNEINLRSDGTLNSIAQNVSNTVTNVTNGISNAVGAVGEGAKDIIDDVLNPYETTQSVPSVDTKGYGILVYHYNSRTGYCTAIVYGGYGVIDSKNTIAVRGGGEYEVFSPTTGECYDKGTFTDTYGQGLTNNNIYYTVVYGDLRNEDGTSAEDKTNNSDITYTDKPIYDFSNATNSELDKVLDELNETLKLETPDLSTMEGLLESIFYRLGKLDSDNDNALLSDINLAILALSNSNDENAAAVIASLAEIRDEIKNMNGDINDNLDDLENNFDKIADFEIPDELLNVDFDNLSDAVKDKIDDIVELITTLVAKGVPMAAINGGLLFYQDIIFNSHEPQDIVFDLTFNGEQYIFTILSTSFFGSEGAQALQIIKNFVSIVLGYAWVLAMRKKAVNMMN